MDKEAISSYQFPPGFRFHPSDEELITHYLLNRVNSRPLPATIMADIELYNYNPWELPQKALFGEEEWYFFSPRDRKYPKGERPNRAAASGYWKATGIDKPILSSAGAQKLGVKKGLVFYTGRAPKGVKTEWVMDEYRVQQTSHSNKLMGSMRLDDWVLCRVRHKGNMSKKVREFPACSTKARIGNFPNMIEPKALNVFSNSDIAADYAYKGCQVLASILREEPIDPIRYVANDVFRRTNYDDGSVKFSTLPYCFSDPFQVTPIGQSINDFCRAENLDLFTNTLSNNNGDLTSEDTLNGNYIDFSIQDQFRMHTQP